MGKKIVSFVADEEEWEEFVRKFKSASAKLRELIHQTLQESEEDKNGTKM